MVHHEAGDAGEGLQQHQHHDRNAQLEVVQAVVDGLVLGDCDDQACYRNSHARNLQAYVDQKPLTEGVLQLHTAGSVSWGETLAKCSKIPSASRIHVQSP